MTEQELRELIREKTKEIQPMVEATTELLAQSFQRGLLTGIDVGERLSKPTEVYLCVLRHDDGTFKMICGCFYSKEAAERYADGSPRITIQKQSVI
jgi:hypothetical protein